MVIFYKITRGTGSVRHEPVQYGEPVHAVLVHMYTYIRNKNCHQHSYGFENFMSSWGSRSKISKLQQVGDFSFFGYKSSLLVSTVSFNYVYTLTVHR